MRCTMQVCTHAWERRLDCPPGKALEAVDAADQHILDAARLRSLRTASQNVEFSVSCHPHAEHLALAAQVSPAAG
jgi:hypothetical protein